MEEINQEQVTPQEFSKKIKLKYPQYKNVDDVVLAKKMIEKYPEYANKVNFEVKKKGSTDGTQADQASVSKSVQQPVKPSSVTEKQVKTQPSASSGGGKMETFTGLSNEDLAKLKQTPEEKPNVEFAKNYTQAVKKGRLTKGNPNALKTESTFQEAYKETTTPGATNPFFKVSPELGVDAEEVARRKRLTEALGVNSKEKIEQEYKNLDLDNPTPYLSASTYNRLETEGLQKDNFINELFSDEKLSAMGINPADFDGYLNQSGFKEQFNKRRQRGDFNSDSRGIMKTSDPKLAEEMYKAKILSNYVSTLNQRAVLKSKLESVKGSYEGKKIPVNKNAKVIDDNLIAAYTEENLPALSKKLNEQDRLNKEKYNELTQDNTGLNSFGTGTKNFFKSALNGFVDSVNKTSSTVYDVLGADDLAEDLRYLNEERQLERPSERQVSFASGKVVGLNGKKYLVDEKGTVYDKDNELIVNDLLDQGSLDKILKDSKTSKEEDWFFSPQGTAVQTGSVLGDMVWQVALQATVGSVTKGTGILNKGLGKLSIPKGTADAIIAQSSLGYAQAYQTTLKEARDAGLTDKEAEEIAGDAAQRTAVWYGITAPISPQTKAVESLFGTAEKSLIKKAVNAYKTNGKQGFISTLNNGLKQIPKKAVAFAEEGAKESVQENVQQAGESLLINAQKNLEAGKEISDETMSYDDFINTSILSFVSGGLISNLSVPSFSGNKKTQIKSLYQLSQNMDVLDTNLNEMVNNKVITKEQADNVKKDAIAVSRNVTRIPKDTDPEIQLDVMRKLSEVEDLENSKKTLDKSFHPQIDVQIQEKRNEVEEIYNSSKTKAEVVTEQSAQEEVTAPQATEMSVITPEKSSNFANLTQDEQGNAVFFHVGDAGYETIKPSSGQSTRTSKDEAAAIGKVGGVAMYYTSPNDEETMVTGPGKYAVKVPIDKVYDFNTDENNYLEEAQKRHEAENPGKAFDANSQLAYITKIAGENGYDMVVAEWGGKTRAQTTKELVPTDTQVSNGAQVTKTFDETYVSNKEKGFEQFVPNPPSEKFYAVYKKIYNDRNSQQKYDELYKLSTSNLDREGVTKLVNESDLPQEIKDEYNKVLNSRDKARRSVKYKVTEPVTVEGAPEGDYLNVGLKIGLSGDTMSTEEVKDSLPEGVEVLEEAVENVKTMPEGKEVIEPTLILKLSRKLTDAEMKQMVLDNQQIAITQMNDGVGVLHGSDIYGDFDSEYFYMPDNRKLSDVVSKEKTIDQEVDEISNLFSTDINKAVENAKAALAKLLPNVKFIIHEDYDSYTKAVGDEDVESGGTYVSGTNTIHINKRAATKTTVAHEVFHALLINMVGTDVKAGEITKRMINALSKQLDNNSDLKEYLDNFIASYDENIKNEEKAAELFGYLAANYDTLPKQSQSLIKRWMEALAKMFGFKPFTDNEVVDFFNTLSEKVATGQEITQSDVKVLGNNKKGILSSLKRFQANFKDPKSGIEFVYDKNSEDFKKLEEEGFITKDKSINDFDGQTIFLHQPDAAFSGLIYKNGQLLVEGKGGVYYPIKFHKDGFFWASTSTTAKKMAKDLNAARKANGGKLLMALTTAPSDKLLSSTTAANGVMEIVISKAFDNGFSISQPKVKSSLIDAANTSIIKEEKKVGLKMNINKSSSLEEVRSAIAEKLNPENSSFADRKLFVEKLLSNIADIVKTNPKAVDQFGKFFSEGIKNEAFKGKTKTGKLSISAANLKQAISEMLTEPMLKEGVDRNKGGQIYAILEIDGDVKEIDSDKHESYPKAIQSVDPENSKVTLNLLTDRVKWSDVFEDPTTGDIVTKERELNIFPTSGVSTTGLKLNTKNLSTPGRKQTSVIVNKVKAAKQAGFSDAAVSQYLQNNGYTAEQASKALIEYNSNRIRRAQKEEGIFLEDTGSKFKNYIGKMRRRMLSARGFKAISQRLGLEERTANIEYQLKMVSNTSKKFDKLLRKYQGDKEKIISDFDLYVRGDKSVTIPNEFIALANIARNQIDGLTDMLIRYQAIPGESADNIRANIGSYMNRAYEIFDNKNWSKKVKQDVVDNAKDFFRTQLLSIAAKNAAISGRNINDEVLNSLDEIQNKVNELDKLLVEYNKSKNNQPQVIDKIKEVSDLMTNYGFREGKEILDYALSAANNINTTKISDKIDSFFKRVSVIKKSATSSKTSGIDLNTQLERDVNDQINRILNKDTGNNFINSGNEGSKDLSILKRKLEMPLEIRALMGEYTDPIQNYANTVNKLANLVYNAKYLTELKEKGLGTIFFEKGDVNTPDNFKEEIASESTKTFDPLGGLFTSKELKEAFSKEGTSLDSLNKSLSKFSIYNYYMKNLRFIKKAKTIQSLGTHMKNVLGAFEFALSNGHVDFKEYAEAYKVVSNDIKEKGNKFLDDKMLEYIKSGVITQNVALGEIKSMFKDDDFEKAFERRMNIASGNKVSRMLKGARSYINKLDKKLIDVYQAEDNLFKIIGFEIERKRYADIEYDKKYNELTDDQKKDVDRIVSENIKNTLPNYDRIPELGKFFKVIPIAATFISFELESIRTSYNTVSLAFSEMKSDNPKSRKLGATRFLALSATQGFRYFLKYLLGSAAFGWLRSLGDDEEEEATKKAKRFTPDYAKNSDIAIVELGNGKFSYVDLSASNPRSKVPKMLEAFSSGDDPSSMLINLVEESMSTFVSNDILVNKIGNLKNNEDDFGNPIFNKYDTPFNIGKDIIGYSYDVFMPGTGTSIKKIYKSDSQVAAAVGQATGYRITDVEIEKQYYFKAKKTAEEAMKATDVYNDAHYKYKKGDLTKEEHDKSLAQANKSLEIIIGEANKDFNAAVFFGANPDVLDETLGKVRLPDSYQVMTGEFVPIESKIPPTKEELLKRMQELREEARNKKINIDEIRRKAKEGR
jgi:hypothetical protein